MELFEILFAIAAIVVAILSDQAKKQKKAARQTENSAENTVSRQGRVNPSSAFEQARQRATQNQRAQQRAQSTAAAGRPDPGRVSAAGVAQSKEQATRQRKQQAQEAMLRGDPLMRPVVTKRERFERSSAYESSNRMDVRYTTSGCGCSTGKGNGSSGKAHGFSSAAYDEEKFFRESREICSGNWS